MRRRGQPQLGPPAAPAPGMAGHWILAGLLVVLAGLALLSASASASASATTSASANARASTIASARPAAVPAVPAGFVGVNVDAGLMVGSSPPLDYAQQLKTMVASGVQSIRVAFDWAGAQPYQAESDVPPAQSGDYTNVAGRPTAFATTDELVGQAARRRIRVLPTLIYAPGWDARHNPDGIDTPKNPGPLAQYAAALVGRYGPHGSFWSSHPGIPKLPIRLWQIWNEPNLAYYWPQPFPRSFVALMRAAHRAIHRADPGAKVVLGALTNFAWRYLADIYRVPGGRASFDVAASNGFTLKPAGVATYLHYVRRAMIAGGDAAKPLIATELSWPSARGKTTQHFDFNTTEAGQARNIAGLLPLLAARRTKLGLLAFYWYTWIGDETQRQYAFSFAGLLRLAHGQVTAKPALAAFKAGALSLERCRRKGAVATRCVKRG